MYFIKTKQQANVIVLVLDITTALPNKQFIHLYVQNYICLIVIYMIKTFVFECLVVWVNHKYICEDNVPNTNNSIINYQSVE